MKKRLSIIVIMFLFTSVFALDIICKRDGEEIPCKVVEIGVDQIKYRKAKNLSGPLYSVAKSSILFVKYENGEKEVFKEEKSTANNYNYGVNQSSNYSYSGNQTSNYLYNANNSKNLKNSISFVFGIGPCDVEELDAESSGSLTFGGNICIPFNSVLASKIGALCSFYFLTNEGSNSTYTFEEQLNFAYFDIPVLLNFMFDAGGISNIYFDIGPRFSFLIASTFEGEYKSATGYSMSIASTDISRSLESFTAGIVIGAGIEINHFVLEGKLDRGVTNVLDADKLSSGSDKSYKSTAFWFTAGFKF